MYVLTLGRALFELSTRHRFVMLGMSSLRFYFCRIALLYPCDALSWLLFILSFHIAGYWYGVCPCLRKRRQRPAAAVSTSNQLAGVPASGQPSHRKHAPLIETPDSHMSALAASGKVIQLSNLRKEFKSAIDKTATRVAVDGVDLTMYEVTT